MADDRLDFTASDIIQLKKELELDQGRQARLTKMQKIRNLRRSTHPVKPPQSFPQVKPIRTRIAADHLRRTVNALTHSGFKIVKEPGRPSRRQRAPAATRLERATKALMKQTQIDQREDTFTMLVDHGAQDGEMISLVLYRPEHWASLPSRFVTDENGNRVMASEYEKDETYLEAVDEAKREASSAGTLPITWERIDPMSYFEIDPAGGHSRMALVVTTHRKYTLMKEFGLVAVRAGLLGRGEKLVPKSKAEQAGSSSIGAMPKGSIEMIQLWTDTDCWYVVDGEIIYHLQHDSGFPFVSTVAQATSSRDPGFASESAVEDLLEVEPALDAALTSESSSLVLHGAPIMVVVRGDQDFAGVSEGDASNPQAETHYEPGDKIELGRGGNAFFLQPPTSELLSSHTAKLSQITSRGTLPPSFRGEATGANEPGWRTAQHIAQTSLVFDQLHRHMEDHLATVVRRIWWLSKHKVKARIPLWSAGVESDSLIERDGEEPGWVYLDPKDIKDYQVEVRIRPLLGASQIQQYQLWRLAHSDGVISKRMLAEKGLESEAPEEWVAEAEIDDLLSLLPIQLRMHEDILRDLGAQQLVELLQQMQAASGLPMTERMGGAQTTPLDRSRNTDAAMDGAVLQQGRAQGEERAPGGPRNEAQIRASNVNGRT